MRSPHPPHLEKKPAQQQRPSTVKINKVKKKKKSTHDKVGLLKVEENVQLQVFVQELYLLVNKFQS